MNFEWWSVLVVVVLFFLLRGLSRTISYRNIVKTSYEEDIPVLIELKGFFWMVYTPKKYDISKDYNWLKIKADVKKGVSEELAVMREKVIALQMLQYEYEKSSRVDLVWKDTDEDTPQSLVVDLDEYTEYNVSSLVVMEEDYIIKEAFKDLLASMQELEDEDHEDL